MAQAASLIVRISADINDFSKQMDAMTRGVDRAASKVESVGKAMTLGITLPVTAAAAVLAKLATENEDIAGRFGRVFGSMSGQVDESIKGMMKSVPETETQLRTLAVSIDNMLQGMEIGPGKAAAMSGAMLTLAGDMAAFNHVPIGDALSALEHGLAGKTKGLLEYGIAISGADIKQKAFSLGILHSGNELTEAGKAQAAFALITERTSRVQGEAARTADQQGKSFAFLKRDLSELADSVSGLVLPSLSSLAKGLDRAVNAIATLPPEVTKTVFVVAGIAAVVGPALLAISSLAKGYIALKAASTILSAGSGVAAFFAAISNPIGIVFAGVVALTAALGALFLIWQKFQSDKDLTSALKTDKNLDAAIGRQNAGAAVATNAATEFNPKAPLEQLQEQSSLVEKAFSRAIDNGGSLSGLFGRINALHAQALDLINAQGGALNKEAVGAREIADQMQRLQDIRDVINAGPAELQGVVNRIANRPVDVGAQGAAQAVDAASKYRLDLAQRLGQSGVPTAFNVEDEAKIQSRALAGIPELGIQGSVDRTLDLQLRLAGMADGFNAAKQASVDLALEQRAASESTQLAFAKLIAPLGSFGEHLTGLSIGMQAAAVSIANAAIAFAQSLAANAGGSGPAAATGRGIGGFLGSIGGMILGAAAGPVGIAIGGAIGGVVGTAAGGLIGKIFDHTQKLTSPVLSEVKALRDLGFTISEIADKLHAPINEVRLAFQQLDGQANLLGKTLDKINGSITNVPQFFKVELERFRAAPLTPPPSPVTPPPPPIINPIFQGKNSTPSGNVVPATTFNIQTLNVTTSATNAKDLMDDIYTQAAKQKATGSRAPFVFAPQAQFAG